MSMSQQVSSEVQAVVTLTDSQTEHSLTHDAVSDDLTSLPPTQDSAVNESFDDFAGNATLPHDTSFQQPVDHSLTQDASAQTDPVTIIIGDASFLVKKLKNSAGSPSRVTTTGNEIEIELSADALTEGSGGDYQAVMQQSDEKENDMMRQQAALMQQPTMVRSGGVMCRGGGVSGPRFRMPVSQPTRMPSGLLVRHPTQQVVITPQLQQQAVPGPQPVVGGSFSCPFCSLTFIDSPALYEHLSILHTVDQKTKWKQPKGREGKTIVPVKRTGRSPGAASQSETGPPVLVPVETSNRLSGAGDAQILGGTSQQSDPQETGLFEDPVEPEIVKKQRGRPSKQAAEEGATPAKCQKIMEENGDGDNEVASVPQSAQQESGSSVSAGEKQNTPAGGKRSGRTPRGRRRS